MIEPIKKLILAWDPDFTKVTPKEANEIEEAEQSGKVIFDCGSEKIYSATPLIKTIPAFGVFRNEPEKFRDCTVDIGGYGIIWNDDLDLSCDELWDNGTEIPRPTSTNDSPSTPRA